MDDATTLTPFLQSLTFVAFDTETTGLWAPSHRVVELGAVRFRLGSSQNETLTSLVNPQRPMPPEVIAIHGITDDMVADAPTVEQLLPRFIDFCSDAVLVAHNAFFDISFVGCELDRCGIPFGDNPILDTVDIYHRLFPGLPGYSLLGLVRHFRIAQTQAHRAAADAEYVRRLLEHAAPAFPPTASLSDLTKSFTTYHMSDWKNEPTAIPSGFEDLAEAADKKRRVCIHYRSSGQPATWRIIRPANVHALGGRLYVTAFCEKANAERTFRLDRIESYELLDP